MALATRHPRSKSRSPFGRMLDTWRITQLEHERNVRLLHKRMYGPGVCDCVYCRKAKQVQQAEQAQDTPPKT